jgi:hypothetical protein
MRFVWPAIAARLSLNATESDDGSYSRETKLCENIIGSGVVLFLTSLLVIGVIIACSAFVKKEAATELVRSQGQMELPENSTNELYVFESGFVEIQP